MAGYAGPVRPRYEPGVLGVPSPRCPKASLELWESPVAVRVLSAVNLSRHCGKSLDGLDFWVHMPKG